MIIINTFSRIKPGTNNVKLLNSAVINKFTMLTYRQPLTGKDRYDQTIFTNGSQPVIWAVGPVNSKVGLACPGQS